ncbi:MAG: hypothetical protein ACRDRN_03910 [Sciscionella sp.]
MYELPGYVWALVLIGVVGIPLAMCGVPYRGAVSARLGRGRAARIAAGAVVVLGGSLTLSAMLVAGGAYRQHVSGFRPWLGLALASGLSGRSTSHRQPCR